MSIRQAIATALVKLNLVPDFDLYQPRGILIVDGIFDEIMRDANADVDLVGGIVGTIARAIDPYGIEGDQVSAKAPSAREVLGRLSQLGVVITIDARARNFHEPIACPITSVITDQPCLLPFGHEAFSPVRFHKFEPKYEDRIAVEGPGPLEQRAIDGDR